MIKITVMKHAGEYRGFVVSGHAGFAKAGKDIICSAVSVLTVTTVNALDADAVTSCVWLSAAGVLVVGICTASSCV